MRLTVIALIMASASALRAQIRPEARLDVVNSGHRLRSEAGLGLSRPIGPFLRATLTVARDLTTSGDTAFTRVEGQVRFLMEPLAEQNWGLSFGAGLGYRRRAYVLALTELEGPRYGGIRPAFQLAIGSGVRFGVLVRRATAGRR